MVGELMVKKIGYELVLFSICLLPERFRRTAVRAFAHVVCGSSRSSARTRQTVMENTLGLGADAAAGLIERWFELKVSDDLDYWLYRTRDRKVMAETIMIRGLEILESALSRGKGAVLCSGHFRGLFPFLVALSTKGYRLSVIRGRPSTTASQIHRWFNERHTFIRGKTTIPFLWMEPENFGVS